MKAAFAKLQGTSAETAATIDLAAISNGELSVQLTSPPKTADELDRVLDMLRALRDVVESDEEVSL